MPLNKGLVEQQRLTYWAGKVWESFLTNCGFLRSSWEPVLFRKTFNCFHTATWSIYMQFSNYHLKAHLLLRHIAGIFDLLYHLAQKWKMRFNGSKCVILSLRSIKLRDSIYLMALIWRTLTCKRIKTYSLDNLYATISPHPSWKSNS